jgi:hypothetical protein
MRVKLRGGHSSQCSIFFFHVRTGLRRRPRRAAPPWSAQACLRLGCKKWLTGENNKAVRHRLVQTAVDSLYCSAHGSRLRQIRLIAARLDRFGMTGEKSSMISSQGASKLAHSKAPSALLKAKLSLTRMPEGATLKSTCRVDCAGPSGLDTTFYSPPGLTPGAILCRPSGSRKHVSRQKLSSECSPVTVLLFDAQSHGWVTHRIRVNPAMRIL